MSCILAAAIGGDMDTEAIMEVIILIGMAGGGDG
jgi:hypothetical protein